MAQELESLAGGYVECAECGHPLEQHSLLGCFGIDECPCKERWTKREIRKIRKQHGLPAAYNAWALEES